jgi:carbamoylphosphate synthase large subunit
MSPLLFVQLSRATPLKSLGVLTLLLFALPFNAVIVLACLGWRQLNRPNHPPGSQPPSAIAKTILISGGKMTKALQLARSFHGAGHRVILVEAHKYWLTGHRFSRAVDRFYTVPAPQADPEAYIEALLAIAKREQVDVYVPVCSPVASYYDALAKDRLADCCQVFHLDPPTVQRLDNKFTFAETARSLGLAVPKSLRITDPRQVLAFDFSQESRPYILKSIRYDSVRRLDLTWLPCATPEATAAFVTHLPISEENPWILQEFITGQEYCTHSTVRQGELRLHGCCPSSAFQVNYQSVDKPEILQWVKTFVEALGLSGQISFDFIQTEEGTVYGIECNPRTHSAITMFYNHPEVAAAYLDPQSLAEPLQPLPSSRPTYWLYHELWRLTEIRSWQQLRSWLRRLGQGKDAILALDDPLPFFMVHHWQIPLLLLDNLRRGKGWLRIDFNIGKLVEPGGD